MARHVLEELSQNKHTKITFNNIYGNSFHSEITLSFK